MEQASGTYSWLGARMDLVRPGSQIDCGNNSFPESRRVSVILLFVCARGTSYLARKEYLDENDYRGTKAYHALFGEPTQTYYTTMAYYARVIGGARM